MTANGTARRGGGPGPERALPAAALAEGAPDGELAAELWLVAGARVARLPDRLVLLEPESERERAAARARAQGRCGCGAPLSRRFDTIVCRSCGRRRARPR